MLQFDKQEVIRHFQASDFDTVSKLLLSAIYDLQAHGDEVPNKETQESHEIFARTLLEVFVQEIYQIPEQYCPLFVSKAPLISNLLATTSFATSDEALKILLNTKNNFIKLLTLYSHRNLIEINLETLFAANPYYTSCWWTNMVAMARRTQITQHSCDKLKSFLKPQVLDKYLQLPFTGHGKFLNDDFYGAINYIDPEKDEPIRKTINKRIEEANFYPNLKINQDGKSNKIAILARNFHHKNAAYKALSPLFYSLKPDYKLTLISVTQDQVLLDGVDHNLFDNVIYLNEIADGLKLPSPEKLQEIADNNFAAIFFAATSPDIITAIVANQRLAPVQLSSYGNPIRTPNIDYYIASDIVEPPSPPQYYSEKPITIPGNAIQAVVPDVVNIQESKDTNAIIIACSWGNSKCNYPLLSTMKKIYSRAKRDVKFMFVGLDNGHLVNAAFRKELEIVLPLDSIITTNNKPFADYILDIAKSDLGIDAYPFGSYNRLMDSFICGKPVLALEGDRSFNRLAQALLKQLGLEELIAIDENDLIMKTVKIIDDEDYRNELSSKILSMDLKEAVRQEDHNNLKKALQGIL